MDYQLLYSKIPRLAPGSSTSPRLLQVHATGPRWFNVLEQSKLLQNKVNNSSDPQHLLTGTLGIAVYLALAGPVCILQNVPRVKIRALDTLTSWAGLLVINKKYTRAKLIVKHSGGEFLEHGHTREKNEEIHPTPTSIIWVLM